jgi:two-component sensor histidine kinase
MAALRLIQRLIERKPGPLATLVGVAACVAAPTALRTAISPVLRDSLPFATYYPAVLLAGLWLGWWLAVLLLSALAADYWFVPPARDLFLAPRDVTGMVVFALSAGLILVAAALLREALFRLNRASTLAQTLNLELQHRVKNNLAVTHGLAMQSMRAGADPSTFYADFRDRLAALGRAHDLLSSGNWTECGFPELPEAALEPFRSSGAVHISGPRCRTPSNACVPLMLALHELATNALKHGALSSAAGEVSLTWRIEPPDRLRIEWVERGGPPVSPPRRKGLGSRLLVRQTGLASVDLAYDPPGVRCAIVVSGVGSAEGRDGRPAESPWIVTPARRPAPAGRDLGRPEGGLAAGGARGVAGRPLAGAIVHTHREIPASPGEAAAGRGGSLT